MGKIFSKSLRKFYSRSGNKIIFKNRLTLNQLALEMCEILGFREIDASVISRVIKGERVFNQRQLSVFSSVLKLDQSELNCLRRALHSEIYSKFQGKYLLSKDEDGFVNSLVNDLEMVKEANGCGFPVLAIDWSTSIENKIRDSLSSGIEAATQPMRLQEFLFRFLEQHAISIIRREMPDMALKKSWPLITEMLTISKELKNPHLEGLVYSKMGDVLSLVGGENGDKRILSRSSSYFQKARLLLNPDMYYYPLSYGMLNVSYLGDEVEFRRLEKELKKQFVNSVPSQTCEAYNLIAKSKVNLGISEGLEDDFIKGWEELGKISPNKKNSKIFRKVQLLRTEIQAAAAGFVFRDLNRLHDVMREGLFFSKGFGYMRYFNTTKDMINENKKLLKFDIPEGI